MKTLTTLIMAIMLVAVTTAYASDDEISVKVSNCKQDDGGWFKSRGDLTCEVEVVNQSMYPLDKTEATVTFLKESETVIIKTIDFGAVPEHYTKRKLVNFGSEIRFKDVTHFNTSGVYKADRSKDALYWWLMQ